MAIYLDEANIQKRSNQIRKLVMPLARKNNVACKVSGVSDRGTITFGTYGGGQPLSTNFRDWYFPTSAELYDASYFEVWRKEHSKFFLEKAYLSIYISDNNCKKEVLSLHTDPTESLNKYKQGPHIHIKSNVTVISKAHISLSLVDQKFVLESFENFVSIYSLAIEMIRIEIIDKM